MGRRSIVTCAALFAWICAPAEAQIVYSADGRLYEIDADGSDREPFTPPTGPRASDSEPTWSPDGTQLLVVHESDAEDDIDRSRIDVLRADGSSRRRLTSLERGVLVSSPRWSPTGDQVAFARFTYGSDRYTSAIVIRDLGGAERTLVRQRLDRRLSSVWGPEWSPDGETLLYSTSRLGRRAYFRSSIRIAPLDGGSTELLRRDAYLPRFSPDASRIAFISIADQNGQTCGSDECSYNGELYVMDADGSNARRLTRSEGDDIAPDWAPDGSRIAFNSDRNFPGYGAHELYSIEPDGNCLTWLTNGTASSAGPAWRPETVNAEPGGCGAVPRPPLIEVDLAPAKAFDATRPLWLGLTYRGLLLSEVDRAPLFFGYYDCAGYRPDDCPPGVQISVQSVCTGTSVRFVGGRVDRRRHALVQDFSGDGLMALTGGAQVHIYSESIRGGPTRAAFRALRPFPGETAVDQLRPPVIPEQLARQIERVVRLHDRLGSVAAVAKRMDIRHETVRQRLRNAKALDDFGHPVRAVRC